VTYLGTATGFFYREGSSRYLVTNRHVIIDENDDYYPDSISILVHTSREDISEVREIEIALYDDKNEPIWFEHKNTDVDVIAICINDYFSGGEVINYLSKHNIESQSEMKPFIEDVENIYIAGYPLGFYDMKNNLPIKRGCTIASQYDIPFEDDPYFLVDARIHQGISGSPVFTPIFVSTREQGSHMQIRHLIGIFAGEHEVDGIALGLGVVWHSSLLTEIIEYQTKGSIREKMR
jgi:hypothetical protein